MFSKAYLKLAAFYLAITMAVSLLFSVAIYQASMSEVYRGFNAQTQAIESAFGPNGPLTRRQFMAERQALLDSIRLRVISRLAFVNMVIFVTSGALSYVLARRTLEPIEEAHKSLERFTADASHELRTPITAMKSEIEVALSDPKLTLKDARAQLESNLEELEKLNMLSTGLLKLAQLDADALIKQSLSLEAVIQGAVDRVLLIAEKKNVLINTSGIKDAQIVGDATSLTESFVTILDNAVKYSPSSSEVIVSSRKQKGYVTVSIKDNGPGIPAAEIPYIFDRFYRADQSRTKQKIDGYGLGLAIAKNIITNHGGKITVTSKIKSGTSVNITLPLT